MDIKRRFAGAAAVLLACIAALLFAALVPARAISPSGGRRYRGIDISEFQGEVDFGKVRRSGIEAVYIRAGAGEYADEYFAENYSRAREAGLRVGFYHYVTARSVEEGRRQARFFASLAAGRRLDMRLAIDFEYFGSLTAEQVNAIAEAYLDELTRVTKKEAVIYSDLRMPVRCSGAGSPKNIRFGRRSTAQTSRPQTANGASGSAFSIRTRAESTAYRETLTEISSQRGYSFRLRAAQTAKRKVPSAKRPGLLYCMSARATRSGK